MNKSKYNVVCVATGAKVGSFMSDGGIRAARFNYRHSHPHLRPNSFIVKKA